MKLLKTPTHICLPGNPTRYEIVAIHASTGNASKTVYSALIEDRAGRCTTVEDIDGCALHYDNAQTPSKTAEEAPSTSTHQCTRCQGKGKYYQWHETGGWHGAYTTCSHCYGTGAAPSKPPKCGKCKGQGYHYSQPGELAATDLRQIYTICQRCLGRGVTQ